MKVKIDTYPIDMLETGMNEMMLWIETQGTIKEVKIIQMNMVESGALQMQKKVVPACMVMIFYDEFVKEKITMEVK